MATVFSLITTLGNAKSTRHVRGNVKRGHFGTAIYERQRIGNKLVMIVLEAEQENSTNWMKSRNLERP